MVTSPFASIRRHWLLWLSRLWRSLSNVSTWEEGLSLPLHWCYTEPNPVNLSYTYTHVLPSDLCFIWSVRTVKVARQLLPEINETYESLVKEWGEQYARQVLDVTVYITDKDRAEAASFRAQIRDLALFKSKKVVFIRPKLGQIVEDYVVDLSEYSVSMWYMWLDKQVYMFSNPNCNCMCMPLFSLSISQSRPL